VYFKEPYDPLNRQAIPKMTTKEKKLDLKQSKINIKELNLYRIVLSRIQCKK